MNKTAWATLGWFFGLQNGREGRLGTISRSNGIDLGGFGLFV